MINRTRESVGEKKTKEKRKKESLNDTRRYKREGGKWNRRDRE